MIRSLSIAAVTLFAVAAFSSAIPARAAGDEPNLRIRVIYTLGEVKANSSDAAALAVPGGDETASVPVAAGEDLTFKVEDGKVVVYTNATERLRASVVDLRHETADGLLGIAAVPFGIGWWWAGVEDRSYPGAIRVKVNAEGKLDVIVETAVEEYLRGVVPQEIGGDSPVEALKAQAVAARSETIVALRSHKYEGDGFDICADVECQVYAGAHKGNASTDEAIRATRGLILSYNGEPFGAFYASNCGGYSESVENVWPDRSGPVPYWSGHPDADEAKGLDLTREENLRQWLASDPPAYCNPSFSSSLPEWTKKNFRWEMESSAEELTALVAKTQDIGRVLRIEAGGRGVSGRLIKARFVGEKGAVEFGPELAIRKVWDPPLKSACFVVDTEGPKDRPEKFILKGAGWGHGVGMCQTGAIARAQAGQDFRTILAAYFHEGIVEAVY